MQNFDYFEIKLNRSFPPWSLGQGILVAEIYINHQPLIELVRQQEEQFVRMEMEEKLKAGDDIDGHYPAGDYLYLPPKMILYPSKNLLDSPWEHGFIIPSDDSRVGKATILGCTCGVIECWFLQVRISLYESSVEWKDFNQFHRDWKYNLGPFLFSRKQYLSQLNQLG